MNSKKLSSSNKKKERTAVVIIHGIGEQRPVNTLRDFVKNVMDEDAEMWEKPDIINGNFETRKITSRLTSKSEEIFDFYEYYWAHNMRDTKFWNMFPWLKKIIFRLPNNISERLKYVYLAFWMTLFFAAILFILNIIFGFISDFKDVLGVFWATLIPLLIPFFTSIIMNLFFNYLGDAAVYLDPDPNNISERNKIREEGIKVVQGLHESGEYKRIVFIGHSLGSVIAYDIVKFLWNKYYNSYSESMLENYMIEKKENKRKAAAIEQAANLLNTGGNPEDYQKSQAEAFDYIKSFGNSWLITHLVTIGSPLAHAKHLFTNSVSDLYELIELRDFPVCPPLTAKPFNSIVMAAEVELPVSHTNQDTDFNMGNMHDKQSLTDNPKKKTKVFYYSHSSPFAVTKWTNLFFSKDIVGGPLSQYFGKGIVDIEIKNMGGLGFLPVGHTRYWDKSYKFQIIGKIRDILSVR